jgi:hypothetical protein
MTSAPCFVVPIWIFPESTSEPRAQGPGYFYGTIRLELVEDLQTILAYEMNGQALQIIARSAAWASR